MRQGILLGDFLCDRVQGVERFAAHPRHLGTSHDKDTGMFAFTFLTITSFPATHGNTG